MIILARVSVRSCSSSFLAVFELFSKLFVCGCCKGSLWVHVPSSVILYCSCNLFLFFVLHQTASVFWAPLLLASASVKDAGSVPCAGFLLQSMNIFRSAQAMLQTTFSRHPSTETMMLPSSALSLSFYIGHSVP